ncbi:MAG TPA: hypothetical protein VF720_11630 [Candidatus Eisenbacteria bacterium]
MAGLAILALTGSGCEDECWDHDCDCPDQDGRPPYTPSGLYSVTGDGRIDLYWNGSPEEDLDFYRVYVSPDRDGPFESIGETGDNHFTDFGAVNSRTEWYAVSAVDLCGHESLITGDDVFDTPRPDGQDLELFSRFGGYPERSGWDLVNRERQPSGAPGTDVWIEGAGSQLDMVAAPGADIQDGGFGAPESVNWAPLEGWSPSGRVELVAGHNVVVHTSDGYYGRFHVIDVRNGRVTVDWAVQLDRGNRELSATPPTESVGPAGQ